jgi:hypothetical protein
VGIDFVTHSGNMASDLSADDYYDAAAEAQSIYDLADNALSWMDSHPAHPCYKDAYTHFHNAMTYYRRGMELFIAFMNIYPNVSEDDVTSVQTAVGDVKSATAEIKASTAALNVQSCD